MATQPPRGRGITLAVLIMRRCLFYAMVVALGSTLTVVAKAPQDSIILVDSHKFPEYRKIWLEKIAATPFDCGRVTLLFPFDPESCISVYTQQSAQGRVYRVTCAWPETNLWQRTDGGRHPQRAKNVKINRIDADIPEKTAELLRAVWLRMLQGARHGTPDLKDWQVIPQDSPDIEWSLERPGNSSIYGQLNKYKANAGKKVDAFLRLSNDSLLDYCRATQSQRRTLAREIERKAMELLSQH